MQKRISSVEYLLVKELIQLKEKSRAQKKTKRFVIEGNDDVFRLIFDFISQTIFELIKRYIDISRSHLNEFVMIKTKLKIETFF